MTRPDDALRAAGRLADALAARVLEVLPLLHDLERGVADAWPDDGGRAWAERASLVRRALERDLDTAAAAVQAARALLDALGPPPPDGPAASASPLPGPVPAAGRGGRGGGPHLGGTDAARADDGSGMRLGAVHD